MLFMTKIETAPLGNSPFLNGLGVSLLNRPVKTLGKSKQFLGISYRVKRMTRENENALLVETHITAKETILNKKTVKNKQQNFKNKISIWF